MLSGVRAGRVPAMLKAVLHPTDTPGLVDVELSDGRTFSELTTGQVRSLAAREGWQIESVSWPPASPYRVLGSLPVTVMAAEYRARYPGTQL